MQFTAVAFAHMRVAQNKWIAPDLMERNLLVGEQYMPGRDRDHQRVSPDRFGNNAITDVSRMSEPDHEVARAQPAQLLGQRHFGQTYLDLGLFGAATGKKRR